MILDQVFPSDQFLSAWQQRFAVLPKHDNPEVNRQNVVRCEVQHGLELYDQF